MLKHLLSLLSILLLTFTMSGGSCDGNTTGGSGGDGDDGEVPDAVEDLLLAAAGDGQSIDIMWIAHDYGNSNAAAGYRVEFLPGDGAAAEQVQDDLSLSAVHDSGGRLGTYRVTAYNDAGDAPAAEADLELWGWTDPYFIPMVELHEEPSMGSSGVTWSPSTHDLGYMINKMQQSADLVDFYVTNLLPGAAAMPHYLASADLAPLVYADSLVVSTIVGLKHTGLLDLGLTPPDLVPDPAMATYLDSVEIIDGHHYAVATNGDYFGVVYVESYLPGDGPEIEIRCWMQPEQNLRVFGLASTPPAPPTHLP
jgi:hypothetical protein